MSKRLTSEQKKKRLLQLREAQRRRRARLREDSCHFVQIILPEQLLKEVRKRCVESGETVQQFIGRLVEETIPAPQEKQSPAFENLPSSLAESPFPEVATVNHVALADEPTEEIRSQPVVDPAEPEISDAVQEPVAPPREERPLPPKIKTSKTLIPTTSAGQLDLFG